MDVVRLLTDCLEDVRGRPVEVVAGQPANDLSYAAARRRFLAGGLRAVREDSPACEWFQLSMEVGDFAWPRLYSRLAIAARELLDSGVAGDFFFMHKPPGLRVRFRAETPERAQRLRAQATALLDPGDGGDLGAATWRRPVAGVYEPETYLFGGAASMEHVHRLFTVDSLAWLDALPHERRSDGPEPEGRQQPEEAAAQAGTAGDWRVSLVLLRALLDGLGIVGWEHRGVWQVVRDEAGRRLPSGLGDLDPQLRRAAAGIRDYWRLPVHAQLDAFPAARRRLLLEHCDAMRRAAEVWRTGYFESGHAEIGPRRAAAHFAVFHWNRGRFTAARQRLLTEALVAAEAQ